MSSLVILSGGMDSTTALYLVRSQGGDAEAISFDYGQRHKRELEYARESCYQLEVAHDVVDISDVGTFLKGSALSDPNVEVPEGHYADESMKLTVVPNRNMIMLSIAIGIAVARGHSGVVAGMHAGDHPIYPDCRPEFIDSMNTTALLANAGFAHPKFAIYTPFIYETKDCIVSRGDELGVEWTLTWSCYKGKRLHCGRCGTCVERREAFSLAGVVDPTEYE